MHSTQKQIEHTGFLHKMQADFDRNSPKNWGRALAKGFVVDSLLPLRAAHTAGAQNNLTISSTSLYRAPQKR
jgi:hypothetical protein